MNAQLPEPSTAASGNDADARSDEQGCLACVTCGLPAVQPKHALLERALYDAYSSGRKDEREEWMPVLEALKFAASVIGHPDDHGSQFIASVIARAEGK